MEIIKFNPLVGGPTIFERGSIVSNIKSIMWVERYLEAGEFELVAPVSSDLHRILPIGTFISHLDTTEVMIVENHEIQEDNKEEPSITITGRSFETLLDNRITGSNNSWTSSGQPNDIYTLVSGRVWNQAKTLIENHILASNLVDDNDAYNNVSVMVDSTSVFPVIGDPVEQERTIQKDTVYKNVLELLEMADLGIKIVRPGDWSPLSTNKNIDLAIIIHRGLNRSTSVTFSHSSGEVVNAQYFWSSRKKKTSAYVYGKWLSTVVHGPEINYGRRMMIINASDLDESYSAIPTGATRTQIISNMNLRAEIALASQRDIAISKAEISKNATRYNYREHYNVGDLVSVEGNYNTTSIMRVIEYVEIQDDNGESSYPTLAEVL